MKWEQTLRSICLIGSFYSLTVITPLHAEPIWIGTWGSVGTGNGQFGIITSGTVGNPVGIAVNTSNGSVYVTDYFNHRVQVFDSAGAYQFQWGSLGAGNGQFNKPRGITIDPATNNVYVGEIANRRIQIFNSTGSYLSKFGSSGHGNGNLWNVQLLAFRPSTNSLYTSEDANHRVQIFDAAGTYQSLFDTYNPDTGQLVGLLAVAVDDLTGQIYVSDQDSHVQVFNSVATYQFSLPGTSAPTGIALHSAANRLYVADSGLNQLLIFDTAGNPLSTFGSVGSGSGQFSTPYGIAPNPSTGQIYIADANNYRVVILFDPVAWTSPGTCTLQQLPLAQNLTLNPGYNLQVQGNTSLSGNSILTLNGGTFTTSTLNLVSGSLALNGGTSSTSSFSLTEGTLTLNGGSFSAATSTLTGGTLALNGGTFNGSSLILAGGKIQASAGSTISASITLNPSITSTFNISPANTLTLSGDISGSGPLIKQGAGNLNLSGANISYTGNTLIQEGSLALTNAAAFNTSGAMNLMAGTLDLTGSAGHHIIGDLSAASGTNISLGANSLTFGTANASILAGTIAGTGGLTKQGSGAAIITQNQPYTGPTAVNAGTLHLQANLDSNSTITVAPGATLMTTGTVSTGPVTANGSLTSGPELGTLTINGNYNLGPNGIHLAKLSLSGANLVKATNNINLTGTLDITPASTEVKAQAFKAGQEYILIEAGGTLTDNLQSMTVNGATFLAFEKVVRNGKILALKLKSNSLQSQMNASAFGLQTASSHALSTTLSDRMGLFASTALQSISSPKVNPEGNIDETAEVNTFAFMHNNLRAQVRNHLHPSRSLLPSGPAPKEEPLARLLSVMESQGTQELKKDAYTFWVSGLYAQGKNDATAISLASRDHQQGVVVGLEYVTPAKHLVGVSLSAGVGHAHSRLNRDNTSSHKYSQLGVYHSTELVSNTWLNSQLVYSFMRSQNQRVAIPVIGSSFLAHSTSNLHSMNWAEELAYTLKLTEAMTLRTGYGFNVWRLQRGAYGESNAGALAQFFRHISRHGFAHQASARLHYGWSTEFYHLGLAGSLKYALTVSGYRLKDTVYTVGGPEAGFAITAPGLGRGTLSPSLTFSGQQKDKGPKLSLSYTANLQVKRKAHELYLEARWNF